MDISHKPRQVLVDEDLQMGLTMVMLLDGILQDVLKYVSKRSYDSKKGADGEMDLADVSIGIDALNSKHISGLARDFATKTVFHFQEGSCAQDAMSHGTFPVDIVSRNTSQFARGRPVSKEAAIFVAAVLE
jgi:hypothetical protein